MIHPYLTFEGDCREAMEYYKSVFGGELEINEFKGSPIEVPENYQSKIMHSSLKFDGGVIMASDKLPDNRISQGSNISISVSDSDPDKVKDLFHKLAHHGTVTHPYSDVFWGGKFGMCRDHFGIYWMVSCENA